MAALSVFLRRGSTSFRQTTGVVRFKSSGTTSIGSSITSTGLADSKSLSSPSFGFSGAGFLVCYHIGVVACLMEHGLLLLPNQILTGCSGGALTTAAIYAGVTPEDGMNCILQIAKKTREAGGMLDALMPGFSLVDQIEQLFLLEMKLALGGSRAIHPSSGCVEGDDYDNELLLRRMQGGRLMRVGLADRRVFPPFGYNEKAYCYVDQYRDVEDVMAACILSSYVPGFTGPALGSKHTGNGAVDRASQRLKEMVDLQFVKSGITGQPVCDTAVVHKEQTKTTFEKNNDAADDVREIYWDGGLVNMYPVVDESTVVVTPVIGDFHPNRAIMPKRDIEDAFQGYGLARNIFPTSFQESHRTKIHLCKDNLFAIRQMALSSDDAVLQERFIQGFDDAKRFIDKHNLTTVHSPQTVSV